MRQIEKRIDVSAVVPLKGPLEVAVSVFLPDTLEVDSAVTTIVATPGGGYGRGYFNMQFPDRSGYSEAEHHAAAGFVFIAMDPLGVGESSIPDLTEVSVEMLAAANDHAVRE